MHITGDQEPLETFSRLVIVMSSSFIPRPRRHFSPTLLSKGNSCLALVDPCEQGDRQSTHVVVFEEVINVPLDALGDFLNELAFSHRTSFSRVVLSGDLSVYLSDEISSTLNLIREPALTLPSIFHYFSSSFRPRCWKDTRKTRSKNELVASEPKTSGTHIHPDSYPTTVIPNGGTVPVADSLKVLRQCVDHFHPGVPIFGEENGRLLVPFLSVAALVRTLRYLFP